MPRIKLLTILASLPLLFGNLAFAAAGDDIQVVDAKVRIVPTVSTTTGAFMKLYNPGNEEQLLVGASTSAARSVELHTHVHDKGVMRMRRIPHIQLPPHSDVSLKKGGLHLMIFGLKQPLKAGDKIELELEFADGSRKTIEAEASK